MPRHRTIEPLESRCVPALVLVNPIADLVAGAGYTSATVELGQLLDPFIQQAGHTLISFALNLDIDPNTPGLQLDTDVATPGIQPPTVTLELFDDRAPLTVQNFLRYATNPNTSADFLGTFFHRSVSGFVVQGGGFNPTATPTHIETFATVHNEFSADRSNVRGTVAMAKVGADAGGGPDSATSEWFVNLADNSANLDAQNGGFTVFGQVLAGMNYIDQIAALPTTTTSGLAGVPVQNFIADPDNNTATPPPKPTADQLITITGVNVQAPAARDTTGQTFEVVGTAVVSGDAGLLAPVLTGSSLKLNYVAGKTGVADVTVRVTQGGETLDETFRVTVQPNLIASVAAERLPNIIVPGDVVKPTIALTNNGAANFNGPVKINFYLSPPTATDTTGRIIDADDILIGSLNQNVSIVAGRSATITGSLTIDARLDKADGAYRLIAEVLPQSGATTELFTNDNAAPDGSGHAYANQFGLVVVSGFGFRSGAKLTYKEPGDLNPVTFSISGAGSGSLRLVDGLVNLAVTGTNSLSVVRLTTPDRAEINNIDVENVVGTVSLARADVTGYVTISNGARVVSLGDVDAGDRSFILGAFGQRNTTPAKLSFRSVHDLNLESDQRISSLTATEWLNTTGTKNSIVAPVLSALTIRGGTGITGDLEADVEQLRASTISIFSIRGFLRDSTVITPGSLGTVRLGGMIDSEILVGTSARPDSLDDFTNRRSIATFIIAGVANAGGVFFADSQVSAASIGTIVVKGVDGASGDGAFGFVADKVGSYTRIGKPVRLALGAPGVIDPLGDYSLTIL
ncbi:MAG: peptidylprolyl isomerase [Chthoniobacteraceae bacterium]